MLFFYIACLAIALAELVWLEMSDVRQSLTQFVAVLSVIITDVGYIYLSCSSSFREAILADKITRIAGCFLPMLFFFTVCEVCHVRLRKWVMFVLVSIQAILYGLIVIDLPSFRFFEVVGYYFNKTGGHLNWIYGPLHRVYMIMVLIYYIGILGIAIFSTRNKSVNNKDISQLVSYSFVVIIGLGIDRVLGMHTELMPIFYSIVLYGALSPIYNSNIYTVYENRKVISEQLEEVGFIAFDTKLNYMGSDNYMLQIFPELRELEVGKPIRRYSKYLQENIITQVREFRDKVMDPNVVNDNNEHFTFRLNGKYYDGKIQILKDYIHRIKGFTMVLKDETEHHEALSLSEKYNDTLTREVNEKTKQIRSIQARIILGMAQVVESRDLSTGGHVKRTSEVIKIFSQELLHADMGFDKRFLKFVERSAPMHDLGKIGVDDAILRWKGKYNDQQYAEMKKHAEIGAKMVRKILTGVEEEQFVRIAENIAHYHHEKVNGKGYPHGLVGNQIPIEARIMAIADVFDALVSKRCYKEEFSYDDAFEIIERDAGTHFDEDLVKVFMQCRTRLERYYDNEREHHL
ncbi:MAG: HD domain-containing protein [Saccharofermentans sp.]|nr:HD domain-containing protein [Saccharofermentans sp.]